MLTMIFFFNWIFSSIFMFLNHPLSLGSILLIQTILVALSTGFLYLNFWFSYILFLVMIGGMLVMFIYMTSIASNEKFNMPKNTILAIYPSLATFTFLVIYPDNITFFTENSEIIFNQLTMTVKNLNMSKYFNFPSMSILIALMIYLLVALIAIVKITGKSRGTLRQK
uniref:NADH-ubiquinone oxidoreductase chain 6 n=1 Tax=Trigonopterus ancora TaxID=2896812 RepID=A0A7H1KHY9_9CUCU|nr:NADH dehydrogenase subunit 6 [Trigonopterus ancora]